MQRDAGAGRDLVAEDETGQELATVDRRNRSIGVGAVDERQQRREDGDTRMALGQHVAVVGVERVDRRRTRERRTGKARAAAVEQDAGTVVPAAELRRRIGVGDRAGPGPAACRGDPDQIEQAAIALPHDVVRQVGEREPADECRYRREGERSARAAIAFDHRRLPFGPVQLGSAQFRSSRSP